MRKTMYDRKKWKEFNRRGYLWEDIGFGYRVRVMLYKYRLKNRRERHLTVRLPKQFYEVSYADLHI